MTKARTAVIGREWLMKVLDPTKYAELYPDDTILV